MTKSLTIDDVQNTLWEIAADSDWSYDDLIDMIKRAGGVHQKLGTTDTKSFLEALVVDGMSEIEAIIAVQLYGMLVGVIRGHA